MLPTFLVSRDQIKNKWIYCSFVSFPLFSFIIDILKREINFVLGGGNAYLADKAVLCSQKWLTTPQILNEVLIV
jgi:hypothetical protein